MVVAVVKRVMIGTKLATELELVMNVVGRIEETCRGDDMRMYVKDINRLCI